MQTGIRVGGKNNWYKVEKSRRSQSTISRGSQVCRSSKPGISARRWAKFNLNTRFFKWRCVQTIPGCLLSLFLCTHTAFLQGTGHSWTPALILNADTAYFGACGRVQECVWENLRPQSSLVKSVVLGWGVQITSNAGESVSS